MFAAAGIVVTEIRTTSARLGVGQRQHPGRAGEGGDHGREASGSEMKLVLGWTEAENPSG
jgi:hypothetical protein